MNSTFLVGQLVLIKVIKGLRRAVVALFFMAIVRLSLHCLMRWRQGNKNCVSKLSLLRWILIGVGVGWPPPTEGPMCPNELTFPARVSTLNNNFQLVHVCSQSVLAKSAIAAVAIPPVEFPFRCACSFTSSFSRCVFTVNLMVF